MSEGLVLVDVNGEDPSPSVKLFVGQIPKSFDVEQIRPLFAAFGRVLDISVIRDKISNEHRGCCFVRMGSKDEAERAIAGLHGVQTLPTLTTPMQVKYADGEIEKFEAKLFVGMLPKTITEEDVRSIFSQYGSVIDATVLREKNGTGKGCAFVKYASRASADRAIKELNGVKKVEGAAGPLVVKYADTAKDRQIKYQMQHTPMSPFNQVPGMAGYLATYGRGMGMPPQYGNGMPGPTPAIPQQSPWGPGPSAPMPMMGNQMMGNQMMNNQMMGNQMPQQAPKSQEGPPGCNIFIYHVPPEFGDADLAIAFSSFGHVISSKVFIDKMTGMSKGFGFISYDNPTSAMNAIQAMNGFQIGNKRLKVQLKTPKTSPY
eukprot:c20564_g2_i2.p1 GENE.c20564_g2_i2~~c20564_g2_i2.p1  ORF type:complete len:373 (+),score=142.81 c20564_g2_i2:84-1202(+)